MDGKPRRRARATGLVASVIAMIVTLIPNAWAIPPEEQLFGIVDSVAGSGCAHAFSGPTKVDHGSFDTIDGSVTYTCSRTYSAMWSGVCLEVLDPVWTQVGCGAALATNSSSANSGVSVPCETIGPMQYRLVGVGASLVGGSNTWRVFMSVGPTATITCTTITA